MGVPKYYYVDSNAGAIEYSNRTWSVGEKMVVAVADASTNHLVAKQWVWECTTAGTSNAIPTWPASVTDNSTTVSQNGVVWTAHAPRSWTYAMPGLYWLAADPTGVTKLTGDANGDIIYVASNHVSVLYGSEIIINFGNSSVGVSPRIISVYPNTTTPTFGGKERTADGVHYMIRGAYYIYGLEINVGNGGSTLAHINKTAVDTWTSYNSLQTYQNCFFVVNNTNSLSRCYMRSYGDQGTELHHRECRYSFRQASQRIMMMTAITYCVNCRLDESSVTISQIFEYSNGKIFVQSFDYRNRATSVHVAVYASCVIEYRNCKLPATLFTGGSSGRNDGMVSFYNCTTSDRILDYYYTDGSSTIQNSTTIYKTNRSAKLRDQDGSVVSYSHEFNPGLYTNNHQLLLEGPWITSQFIRETGPWSVTLDIAYDSATALKDNEIWMEVEYYSDETSPLTTTVITAPTLSNSVLSRDLFATGTNLNEVNEVWTGTGGWANKKTARLHKIVDVKQQGTVRVRVIVARDATVYVDPLVMLRKRREVTTLWVWGANGSGQFGTGTTTNVLSPCVFFGSGATWLKTTRNELQLDTTVSREHIAAIKADGTLWLSGFNNYGQLGDGTTTNRSSPVTTAGGGTNWSFIKCSTYSVALKTNGTLWTWGDNSYGQLGDGTTTARSSPVTTAGGGTNWSVINSSNISLYTAVSVVAIKTDGTLWTWGGNAYGQLGDGTTTARSSPVTTAGGGTNWSQVKCGNLCMAAIKTDGTLWTWGSNSFGQLGDGTTTSRSSPVTTSGGGTNWSQVDCGNLYMAAIKTDGTLWTWGTNSDGRLGTNNTIDKSSPVSVAGSNTNWSQVTCNFGSMSAIKTDGTLWTWGSNYYGQLGDGTTTSRSSPVSVLGGFNDWITPNLRRSYI